MIFFYIIYEYKGYIIIIKIWKNRGCGFKGFKINYAIPIDGDIYKNCSISIIVLHVKGWFKYQFGWVDSNSTE